MYRRFWIAALLLGGCAHTEDPEYVFDVQLANEYYKNGKFEEAMKKYEDAVEKNPRGYEAIVGLGCASREWGFRKFIEAEDLHRARKAELAEKEFKKASNVHDSAQRLFLKAIEQRPDDLLAHRELGFFYYKRATTPYSYPYRLDDKENRRRELQLAIEKFQKVVQKVPKEYFAQRYLGLALFAQGDSPQGRVHLEAYLWGMDRARKYILKSSTGKTAEEREDAANRLREIDKELAEVQDMLHGYVGSLQEEKKKARIVIEATQNERERETDPRNFAALDKKIADNQTAFERVSVEILAVEQLIGRYKEVKESKTKEEGTKQ